MAVRDGVVTGALKSKGIAPSVNVAVVADGSVKSAVGTCGERINSHSRSRINTHLPKQNGAG